MAIQFTGFTDEAGFDLATQIKATQSLGWSHLSLRSIEGTNAHDLPDETFAKAADTLDEAGTSVAEFGSLIGTWGKKIDTDFQITLDEVDRCIKRMHRTGTQTVRIMSYAQEPWGQDQHEQERFKRLREIVKRFAGEGITAAHENCMNYGGFSADHTLRLIEEVPGMKLIFDTGNPVFQRDRGQPEPYPWQDSWAFYQAVKEHIVHVHVKDCRMLPPRESASVNDWPADSSPEPEYLMPGEGDANVKKILDDMIGRGYEGFVAIEPHVATVFHLEEGQKPDWQQCFDSFVEYGKKMQALLN